MSKQDVKAAKQQVAESKHVLEIRSGAQKIMKRRVKEYSEIHAKLECRSRDRVAKQKFNLYKERFVREVEQDAKQQNPKIEFTTITVPDLDRGWDNMGRLAYKSSSKMVENSGYDRGAVRSCVKRAIAEAIEDGRKTVTRDEIVEDIKKNASTSSAIKWLANKDSACGIEYKVEASDRAIKLDVAKYEVHYANFKFVKYENGKKVDEGEEDILKAKLEVWKAKLEVAKCEYDGCEEGGGRFVNAQRNLKTATQRLHDLAPNSKLQSAYSDVDYRCCCIL